MKPEVDKAPVLHHPFDFFGVGDVACGIGAHDHEVGKIAGADRADLGVAARAALSLQQFGRPRGRRLQCLHGREPRLDQHLHLVMQAQARRSPGDGIGAGLDLAARRDVSLGEFEHVLESDLELLAVLRRQATDPRHVFIARGKILDLPLPRQNAVADVAGKIDEVGIADDEIVLELPRAGAPAHAAPFVVQRRIEVGAAPDRVGDHRIELGPIGQKRRPGQKLAFPKRTPLLRRHEGVCEAPDMLDDVDSVAQRGRRVVSMAEDQKACLVDFVSRDGVGAGKPLVVLREPGQVGFGLQPGPHPLADVRLGGVFGNRRPASAVEEARKTVRVLAPRAQGLGQVVERDYRGHAMVDIELAHPLVPVHMGIEQSRDDEFSAEIEHLRARRHGGVHGQQVANGVALDQQRAVS